MILDIACPAWCGAVKDNALSRGAFEALRLFYIKPLEVIASSCFPVNLRVKTR